MIITKKLALEVCEKNAATSELSSEQKQQPCFTNQDDLNRDCKRPCYEINKEKRKAYASSYYSSHKDLKKRLQQ